MFESIAAAAVFGLSGGLSPGPLLALVVAETLARGRRAGLAVAASPLITDGPIIAAALFLLSRIEESDSAIGMISLAGGALLVSYGIAAFRGAPSNLEETEADGRVWRSLIKGIGANFLNPSPYLFWLTIGAPMLLQAADYGWPIAAAFLAVFYLGLVGSKAVLAVFVARSREVLRGGAYVWANRAIAIVLLVYAAIFIRRGLFLLTTG